MQKDVGVAMGTQLGPALANLVSFHFEEQWMSACPIDYNCISYRRYADEKCFLFSSELCMAKFSNYMNSNHRKSKFTVDHEENYSLSFLDKKYFRERWKLHTSVDRKPTFCFALTNY